jgi:hypothetical protein
MGKKERPERLARTKLALAEKYDRLAAEARSRRKKLRFVHKAKKYRLQARVAVPA